MSGGVHGHGVFADASVRREYSSRCCGPCPNGQTTAGVDTHRKVERWRVHLRPDATIRTGGVAASPMAYDPRPRLSLTSPRPLHETRSPVIPTDVGVEVIAQARVVLNEAGRLTELSRNGSGAVAGELRLAVIPTLAPYLLPRAIRGVRQQGASAGGPSAVAAARSVARGSLAAVGRALHARAGRDVMPTASVKERRG